MEFLSPFGEGTIQKGMVRTRGMAGSFKSKKKKKNPVLSAGNCPREKENDTIKTLLQKLHCFKE